MHAEIRQARKHANARIGFVIHLVVFMVVNALLAGINLFTSPQHLWFIWPLLGWGTGLVFHGLSLVLAAWLHPWRERMIARELARRA